MKTYKFKNPLDALDREDFLKLRALFEHPNLDLFTASKILGLNPLEDFRGVDLSNITIPNLERANENSNDAADFGSSIGGVESDVNSIPQDHFVELVDSEWFPILESEIELKEESYDELFSAVLDGNLEYVQYVFENKEFAASENVGSKKHETSNLANWIENDRHNFSLVMAASESGNIEIVELLVEKGFSGTSLTGDGWSALHSAARNGNADIVKFLVERNAVIDAATETGVTPIMLASLNGYYDVVRYLAETGALIEFTAKNGATPLMVAASNGHTQIVKFLIDRGSRVDRCLNSGETAAEVAQARGHVECAEYLSNF